jgi:hypothetical protein
MFDLAKSFYSKDWWDEKPVKETIDDWLDAINDRPGTTEPRCYLVKHRMTYKPAGVDGLWIFRKPVYRVKCGRREW